ncbi:hypothetical protein QQF64_031855 [Cirrhinus molitorella]|uniref:Endonuclease/exonuclease/phosphatase domain-containing protein n=1 Tax=Cirrhinus molitorella TaxID=172907 RepID=A0ABR3MYA4_9TELE
MPNVHLAHHPTLDLCHLHDHVHLRKDSVHLFAKTLKDVALGQTLAVPQRRLEQPLPLSHQTNHFQAQGSVLICGDLNARTGSLPDYITDNGK